MPIAAIPCIFGVMIEFSTWPAPLSSAVSAEVVLPGSKSLTNRELVLSALAEEPTELISPLVSRDTELMIASLKSLGTKFLWQGSDLLVTPGELSGPAKIDCGLAGTVMRFVPPLSMLVDGEVSFDGDAGARARPMKTTIQSMQALGAEVTSGANSLPFTVIGKGAVTGGVLTIDASASSQFVSGLLLSAAKFNQGLTLSHKGHGLPSLPHIEMTLHTLRARGVKAEALDNSSWKVEPGPISGGKVVIEPDLSNAGPFLAAAMVTGGTVKIPNWPSSTTQVGDHYRKLLTRMGANIEVVNDVLTISGSGEIIGLEADLSEAGELAPTIAALCALAVSPSKLIGIGHLRGHETDRLAALVAEINNLGGNAKELADGIEITPQLLHGGLWHTYHDHRMATSGAIIGLAVSGVEVENIETTAKTMPNFAKMWLEMLGA